MRFTRLLCLVALLGCGEGSTTPNAATGHFELISVNEQPLPWIRPPSSGSFGEVIRVGDVVLHDDGTFQLGVDSYARGTYTVDGSALRLAIAGGTALAGSIGGDSVVVDIPGQPALHLFFRRSLRARPVVTDGLFMLAAINGRAEPLIASDETRDGERIVARILYDSLTFIDGVFFRQHRASSVTSYADGRAGIASEREDVYYGAYRGQSDSLTLTPYVTLASGQSTLRFAYEQQQLVSRIGLAAGSYEERYIRR